MPKKLPENNGVKKFGGDTETHYTDEQKGKALAIVEINHWDIKKTAEQLGISERAIRYWLVQEEKYEQYREAMKRDFDMRLDAIVDQVIERMLAVIPDEKNLQTLANTLGIIIEKKVLLNDGEAGWKGGVDGASGSAQPTQIFDLKTQINVLLERAPAVIEMAKRIVGSDDPSNGSESKK